MNDYVSGELSRVQGGRAFLRLYLECVVPEIPAKADRNKLCYMYYATFILNRIPREYKLFWQQSYFTAVEISLQE